MVKKQWKLVVGKHGPDKHNRPGFMGWLHTGKLGHKRFKSSGVFERAQQATWQNRQRLPVIELYGPTFTQIIMGEEVQKDIQSGQALLNLIKFVEKFGKVKNV
jgi:hypothetical protein